MYLIILLRLIWEGMVKIVGRACFIIIMLNNYSLSPRIFPLKLDFSNNAACVATICEHLQIRWNERNFDLFPDWNDPHLRKIVSSRSQLCGKTSDVRWNCFVENFLRIFHKTFQGLFFEPVIPLLHSRIPSIFLFSLHLILATRIGRVCLQVLLSRLLVEQSGLRFLLYHVQILSQLFPNLHRLFIHFEEHFIGLFCIFSNSIFQTLSNLTYVGAFMTIVFDYEACHGKLQFRNLNNDIFIFSSLCCLQYFNCIIHGSVKCRNVLHSFTTWCWFKLSINEVQHCTLFTHVVLAVNAVFHCRW